MTHLENYTFSKTFVDELIESGFDGIPEMFRIIMNNAMKAERDQFLQADKYERTEDRLGYANGYKPKTIKSRVGEVTLDIPQVREGGFYLSSLEKGMRSERALQLTLAEMYVQGVSTRKVKAITEQLCGVEISSMQVSRAAGHATRRSTARMARTATGRDPVLFLDARYEKVREASQVRDAAVLLATGITPEGQRQVLGVSVSLSEHETHWRAFLKGLKDRGLRNIEMITSDAHEGLGAARRAVFGSVPWQRCQFHLQQNAGRYVTRQTMRVEVAADIRAIFNAPDRQTAEQYLHMAIQKYAEFDPFLN